MPPITPPLNLTIRFSSSAADLPLTVPSPATTTPLFLKRRIRLLRSADTSTRRLRLFHAGKPLQDTTPLGDALRAVFPPLPPPPLHGDPKGKGKAREVAVEEPPPQQQQQPIFLICFVGDELSAAELAAEQTAASASTAATTSTTAASTATTGTSPPPPQPRGFDRLLTAGFTPAEVAQLRAQFEQLQSYSYTPDTMPSAAEMRLLEDRWIDESVAPGTGGGGGVGEDEIGVASGSYEDMLLGTMVGFFWPLGAVLWLLREEGVWSKRRQMAVVAGMLVNIAFSVLRNTS